MCIYIYIYACIYVYSMCVCIYFILVHQCFPHYIRSYISALKAFYMFLTNF